MDFSLGSEKTLEIQAPLLERVVTTPSLTSVSYGKGLKGCTPFLIQATTVSLLLGFCTEGHGQALHERPYSFQVFTSQVA